MIPPSGRSAVRQGGQLEALVEATLTAKGFTAVPYRAWQAKPTAFGSEVVIRRVPYQTIYGQTGYTEFVLRSNRTAESPVRIECKWQQASGSVDEKFPYLYLNACAMPEPTVILLLDGGGAKPAAIQWLREAAAAHRYQSAATPKTIHVWALADFVAWANRTFR